MRHTSPRTASQRQQRVAENIRHKLAEMLARGEVHLGGLPDHSITVTEVRVSPDLKNATAYIMPLGGVAMDETLVALNAAGGQMRGPLTRALGLRYAPKLNFVADDSFGYADKIEKILHSPAVARDLEEK